MVSDGELVKRDAYWNEFYSVGRHFLINDASSFAEQVASKLELPSLIYEFGCGNGRDSLFFADRGHVVVAIDSSASAISCVNSRVSDHNGVNIRTVQARVDGHALVERLCEHARCLDELSLMKVVVYARFFLHALTEEEQAAFLAISMKLLRNGGLLAVEFRTCEDQLGTKTTRPHYRRYIDPQNFIEEVCRHGLRVMHFQQGRGLATQGVDDAHVARILLNRTGSVE